MAVSSPVRRPKSLITVSFKLPEELISDIDEFRAAGSKKKSRSCFIKEACELKASMEAINRLGYYRLREI